MKSLTNGQVKASWDSLRSARGRNFWTMLGVIIGISSVITVVSIGEGIKMQIVGQINHFGKNLIVVMPDRHDTKSSSLGAGGIPSVGITLTDKDILAATTSTHIAAAAPVSVVPGSVKAENGLYTGGSVIGTTSDFLVLTNQSVDFGVFLTPTDQGQNVAVLGSRAAQSMFNETSPLGRTFTIRGQQFVVNGVLNEYDNTPLSQSADFNNAIFIPHDTGQAISGGAAVTFELLAKTERPNQTDTAIVGLRKSLAKIHGGEADIIVARQNQTVAGTQGVLDLLTRLIASVAAISLLVGGVGIMNVMLVSVAERTHEIGIRKAIGATNRQILSQFVIEATLLSLIGGLIGLLIAFAIDVALRLATDIQPVIQWQVVVMATGVSLLVGIIFGSVPALKAAHKHPIEALRGQ